MANDPTKAPEFKRVLGKLLSTPHKPQSELKVGRTPPKPHGSMTVKGGGQKELQLQTSRKSGSKPKKS